MAKYQGSLRADLGGILYFEIQISIQNALFCSLFILKHDSGIFILYLCLHAFLVTHHTLYFERFKLQTTVTSTSIFESRSSL